MSPDFDPLAELSRLAALRARLAAVFGVAESALLPVRGFAHASSLLGALLREGRALSLVDARLIEWRAASSAQGPAADGEALVYREIGPAYGAPQPLSGALIGAPALIARLEALVDPDHLHPLLVEETLKALSPARLAICDARQAALRAERARFIKALAAAPGVRRVAEDGDGLLVEARDEVEALRRGALFGAEMTAREDGRIRVGVGEPAANDLALAAFGAATDRALRIGEAVRETKETRIAVRVDLDRAGAARIATGVGFFDHMLEQVAAHGGFSLTLACEGDTHVDLHHTIEDCALALGTALSKALGERRGVARYGFTLPMDEAEARVSIDLGGRPYAVFEGAFAAPLLGAYPTEMTAHVFRSLAQTLGAAIHVSVRGENDHHKTEACFKAFARALRAAVAVEGEAVPSTKGVL